MKKLSEKHKRVVNCYLSNGLNKTQALIEAGYSATYANKNTHSVFSRPEVKAYIAELQAKTAKKLEITREDVIKKAIEITQLYDELARLAMIDDPTLEEELKYARLVNIIKASDSNKAIDTILKANGWNEPDKLDVNIKNYKANFGS